MGRCRRHPHHLVVGVCAHCLNDRLLALMKEDVVESAEHGDFQSAHIIFSSKMSPIGLSSSLPTGIVPQPPPTTTRVASMESNRHHVKHMAASYLKRHQSLTSSPQYQPMISASPLFDAGPRTPPIINNNHFIKGEITRKKNSSLWSLLHRHRDDRTIDNRHDYGHDGRHEHRDYHDGMRAHGVEASDYNVMSKSLRRRLGSGSSWITKEDGGYDSHGYGDKLSYSTSVKEAHESICRGNASSLLSSPHFASPKSSSCHHFPSPTSKYISQRPLNNERYGDEITSPGRQHGSFAFNRHVDNYRGHYSSSSWISSFFPRRSRRSKSISGTGALGICQQANRDSAGASPDMAPRRKKQVSFNADEDVIESPKCKAMKSPQGTVNGVYSKSPRDLHEHVNEVYTKSPNMHEHGHEHLKNPKPLNKSPKSSFYGVFSKSATRQGHIHGGEANADEVAYLSDTNALKSPRAYLSSDTTAFKSPRAKLSSLLTKRRSGTVSIDCGRDVRVSPVPMLRVKRDDLSHHHLLHGGNYHQNHQQQQHHGQHQHYHPQHHHQGYNNDETEPKADLQKSPKMDSTNTMPSEKAFLKSPRLAALSAMNQFLKSPKLASVKTMNLDSEEDGKHLYSHSTSWRKSLSKTLSPMLGLKHRKKQEQEQAMGHDGFHHPRHAHHDHHHDDKLQNHHDGPDTQHGHHNHHHIEPQHGHHDQHHSDHQLGHHRYHHSHGPNKAEESLVRETHVLPAKGPPQKYSFLSKDYSAFSFYFSPRHAGNADGAAYTSYNKSSVPAGNGSPWSSYPSLSSKAGGGGISGRGRF